KSTPVAAPAARTPVTGDEGESPAAASRPPRVRRRTRVQRAAGSAEAVPGAGSATGSDAIGEETASGPAAPPVDAPDAAVDGDGVTEPRHDGLTELRGMFSGSDEEPVRDDAEDRGAVPEADDTADPEHGAPAPAEDVEADRAEDVESDASAIVDAENVDDAPQDVLDEPAADTGTSATAPAQRDADATGETAAEPVDLSAGEPEPEAEPEPQLEDADGDEPEADAAAEIVGDGEQGSASEVGAGVAIAGVQEPEDEAAPGTQPDPAPAPPRAVTVRTDSLTAPRSTRPGLAGVAETALTPSVRGDRAAAPELGDDVLVIEGLTKRFDEKVAVDDIALTVRAGSFYGVVGPNGAGKTTTMSMVTGLLRPDAGTVHVNGIDVWREPLTAKRSIGVLPDRLRLFDRLTGAQLLHYSGALRGLDDAEIRSRSADLVAAFGLEDAVGRLVTDYSAGMTKKVALACAMIHSPRMLVLDEPFESVDPVSAANVVEILQDYVAHGGTVVLSSHGMDFIQRICDHVAIIVNGRVLAAGTMDEVRAGRSLEERFVALAGGRRTAEGFSWLHSFSD
uniref:ATP-binding cassette domain-containing protein n=2 Tax=Clavibacter lycopersici TaxID=2301718 RepID=UPI0035CAFE59